jgi:hypothetical protein
MMSISGGHFRRVVQPESRPQSTPGRHPQATFEVAILAHPDGAQHAALDSAVGQAIPHVRHQFERGTFQPVVVVITIALPLLVARKRIELSTLINVPREKLGPELNVGFDVLTEIPVLYQFVALCDKGDLARNKALQRQLAE